MTNNLAHKRITIGIDASRAFVENPAGPEYYSWHLIKNLAEIDRKNRYILYLRPGQKPDFKLPQNFEYKNVGMRYLWTQVFLAFELILRPVDVLFIPAHTLPLACKVFLPQMPIVVTVHGLEGKFLPQSGNFLAHIHRNWSITWSVRLATKLIAVSRDTMIDVIKTYQIDTKKIEVIHEGVDMQKYKYKSKSKIIKKDYGTRNSSYILFVGTVQPRKNLVRLIRAFSLISDRKIKLVIAGKLGWLYEDVLSAPKKYGIKDRVVFAGRIDDLGLVGLYKGSKAFILPSITEGFGLPILEAQAAGVPVISSNRGALPEVGGRGAIYINPYSIRSIKQAIDMILKDKKLGTKLVEEGYRNIDNFSWTKTAYNTLTVLLQAIK